MGDTKVAHPTGFEPVIPGFVDRCLIQFGHGCFEQIALRGALSGRMREFSRCFLVSV